jgi:ParB/RepB/Spo0J family partition protein
VLADFLRRNLTGTTPNPPETNMDNDQITITSLDHAGVGESGPTTTIPAYPLEQLTPAPWNPRKHFDEAQLAELAQDIATRGVLQPLVVRTCPSNSSRYEIVCGERRFRAAGRAGLAAVPVVVRQLDDREALECAISENGQRENLHPLEEADGFLALHTLHGEGVEDIAARFGVSTKLVHERLTLSKLCGEGRKAFLEGKLTWGVALRVARLPSQDYQREAVKYFIEDRPQWQGPLTAGDAARWIDQRYHLRLATAPFDTKSSSLLAGVGACAGCPKNSDAQVTVFDDVTPGQCMDPVCFSRKKEAAWQQAAADAAAEGRRVLTAEQSAAIAPPYNGAPWRDGYVPLDEKPAEYGGRKTWAQLLGDHAPTPVVVRGADGQAVPLYSPDDFKAAVKKAGLKPLKKAPKRSSSGSSSNASWKKQQEEREAVALGQVRAIADAFAKRTVPTDDRAWWQALTRAVLLNESSSMKAVAVHLKLDLTKKRKGVVGEYQQMFAAVAEEIDARSPGGCRELLVLGMLGCALGGDDNLPDTHLPLAKVYGIDPKALTKKVKADLESAKKKPAAEVAKPSGKKTTKAAPAAKKAPAKPAAKKGARK